MTALLAVEQNNTDKVTLYVADCRRMGLDVLPPDINASNWDFTIEDRQDGTSAIRFGLGAVKNVGHGPVDIICKARADGQFTDINDLIQRADLRKVGKRALECLIKVGALDTFGDRPSLLESLDRIVSISGSHFKAADMGQMSLFGADTGLIEEIHLPPAAVNISRREQLNWERELIGVYISDHPLSPAMDAIRQNVTHYSAELAEAHAQQSVRVAGLITRIRPYTTKKGAPMAFVTLEDLQGHIDLVIFPRIWEQVQEIVEWDAIVMVDGKVDTYGAEPKVLVDQITTELTHVTPLETKSRSPKSPSYQNETLAQGSQETAVEEETATDANLTEESSTYTQPEVVDDDGLPPPPDAFPQDWDPIFEPPVKAPVEAKNGQISAASLDDTSSIEAQNSEEADTTPESVDYPSESFGEVQPENHTEPQSEIQTLATESSSMTTDATPPESTAEEPEVNDPIIKAEVSEKVITPFIPPVPSSDGQDVNMITIILRPRADKVRDNLLLRRVFGLMISSPGNDRFAFHIFENGRGHLLEFPNLTTGMNPELMARLIALVGPENIRVEPITFQ
jgi:DNA polymerase-3 subunit alpha